MKAERDCREPTMRSIPVRTSRDSVIDVFSFILPSYYHAPQTQEWVYSYRPPLRFPSGKVLSRRMTHAKQQMFDHAEGDPSHRNSDAVGNGHTGECRGNDIAQL